MLTIIAALALMAPECAALPRTLGGWERSGTGLDTRHATTIPAKNGAAETQVTIRKAGAFGIVADQPGWIDVAREKGRPLRMEARRNGIACAGIAKIVYYRLQPGTYRVTIAKLQTPQVKLMLVHGDRARGFARGGRVG
ncbi:hypothetical protein [Sphingomonas pokkalii]|uniref:Uncharacterized protein n=1 Tax=Sphingomonas pokkalii TaxID=2175090 RepID=A0A2U0SA69_9SPHN|nr:hypothetical protein [Sphingomonas pokkalii]PVX28171.1 hypothetical protein DD559_01460 [Sphingomonas pokkalii]